VGPFIGFILYKGGIVFLRQPMLNVIGDKQT